MGFLDVNSVSDTQQSSCETSLLMGEVCIAEDRKICLSLAVILSKLAHCTLRQVFYIEFNYVRLCYASYSQRRILISHKLYEILPVNRTTQACLRGTGTVVLHLSHATLIINRRCDSPEYLYSDDPMANTFAEA